jgi:hypothetical protein
MFQYIFNILNAFASKNTLLSDVINTRRMLTYEKDTDREIEKMSRECDTVLLDMFRESIVENFHNI